MAESADLYRVLGVSRDADIETISRAYRRLARRFHPDLYNGSDATVRMQQLNHAYDVLADPLQRQAYDATLPYRQPRPTPQPQSSPPPQQAAANGYHGYADKATYDEAWRAQQERFAWYRQYQAPQGTDWRVNPVDYRFNKGWYQGEFMFLVFQTNPEYVWRVVQEGIGDEDDQAAAKAFLQGLPSQYTMDVKIEPPSKALFVVTAVVLELVFGWISTTFIPSQHGSTGKDDLGSYVFNIGIYSIAIAVVLCYFAIRFWREFSARQARRRLLDQE